MITGDLIRIKNMVDDCVRLARNIQREAERLTPEEQTQLASHVSGSAAQFSYLLGLLTKGEQPPASHS